MSELPRVVWEGAGYRAVLMRDRTGMSDSERERYPLFSEGHRLAIEWHSGTTDAMGQRLHWEPLARPSDLHLALIKAILAKEPSP